ncbi:MAG: hypothetical protein ABW154_09665 [Dyella sp.]
MNERDAQINRALHALDQAHQLGSLARSEYRARRRELLQRLQLANEITARNTLRPDALAAAVPHLPLSLRTPSERQRGNKRVRAAVAWRYVLILSLVLLAGGILLYGLMREG